MPVITFAGENLIAQQQQAGQTLIIDQMILANINGLDHNLVPNRSEAMPSVGDIKVTQTITKDGLINSNTVVYSAVFTSTQGTFDFNWMGLYSSEHNVLVAVAYIPVQSKVGTVGASIGNIITKNFAIEFNGAVDLTGINVNAESWQIDYSARMLSIDIKQRGMAKNIYGEGTFLNDAFKIKYENSKYYLTQGQAVLSGLHDELTQDFEITPGAFPKTVWLDVYQETTMAGVENKFDVTFSDGGTLSDYASGGVEHSLVRIGTIPQFGIITDERAVVTASLSAYNPGNIPHADVNTKGLTKLSSSIDNASESEAATPKAIKTVQDYFHMRTAKVFSDLEELVAENIEVGQAVKIKGDDDFLVVPPGTGAVGLGRYYDLENGNQIKRIIHSQVDTIADLRNVTPVYHGQSWAVLGVVKIGLGGGVYYYDANDTTSVDTIGSTVVIGGKRLKRRRDGPFTPYMFGVIGDGVIDDHSALSLAISVSSRLDMQDAYCYLSLELEAVDNMHLYSNSGGGLTTDVGAGANYANSLIVGFDKNNIKINGLRLDGPGGGRSGSWEDVGTLDGVGACILLAGCSGISIRDNICTRGGDPATGNGIAAIYLSSCVGVNVNENEISLADNGIVSDQWYTKLVENTAKYQQATNISDNILFDLSGRAIAIEHLDNSQGGDDVVSNNIAFNILNAGLQIRSARGLVAEGNVFDMANVGRTSEITDSKNGLYGIDGANASGKIIANGNIILNPRSIGMLFYNATDLTASDNIISHDDNLGINNFQATIGILVQNTDSNDLHRLLLTDNNVAVGTNDAIRVSKADGWIGNATQIMINSNIVNNDGLRGIYCDYPKDLTMNDNNIRPKTTYGGYVGMTVVSSASPSLAGNSIQQCSTGILLSSCTSPNTRNTIENCTNGINYRSNSGGASFDLIRGGVTAYEISDYGVGGQLDATNAVLDGPTSYKSTAANSVLIRVKGSVVPTTGNWGRGDIVDNTLPLTVTDDLLWMCVAAGTPGTWAKSVLQAV